MSEDENQDDTNISSCLEQDSSETNDIVENITSILTEYNEETHYSEFVENYNDDEDDDIYLQPLSVAARFDNILSLQLTRLRSKQDFDFPGRKKFSEGETQTEKNADAGGERTSLSSLLQLKLLAESLFHVLETIQTAVHFDSNMFSSTDQNVLEDISQRLDEIEVEFKQQGFEFLNENLREKTTTLTKTQTEFHNALSNSNHFDRDAMVLNLKFLLQTATDVGIMQGQTVFANDVSNILTVIKKITVDLRREIEEKRGIDKATSSSGATVLKEPHNQDKTDSCQSQLCTSQNKNKKMYDSKNVKDADISDSEHPSKASDFTRQNLNEDESNVTENGDDLEEQGEDVCSTSKSKVNVNEKGAGLAENFEDVGSTQKNDVNVYKKGVNLAGKVEDVGLTSKNDVEQSPIGHMKDEQAPTVGTDNGINGSPVTNNKQNIDPTESIVSSWNADNTEGEFEKKTHTNESFQNISRHTRSHILNEQFLGDSKLNGEDEPSYYSGEEITGRTSFNDHSAQYQPPHSPPGLPLTVTKKTEREQSPNASVPGDGVESFGYFPTNGTKGTINDEIPRFRQDSNSAVTQAGITTGLHDDRTSSPGFQHDSGLKDVKSADQSNFEELLDTIVPGPSVPRSETKDSLQKSLPTLYPDSDSSVKKDTSTDKVYHHEYQHNHNPEADYESEMSPRQGMTIPKTVNEGRTESYPQNQQEEENAPQSNLITLNNTEQPSSNRQNKYNRQQISPDISSNQFGRINTAHAEADEDDLQTGLQNVAPQGLRETCRHTHPDSLMDDIRRQTSDLQIKDASFNEQNENERNTDTGHEETDNVPDTYGAKKPKIHGPERLEDYLSADQMNDSLDYRNPHERWKRDVLRLKHGFDSQSTLVDFIQDQASMIEHEKDKALLQKGGVQLYASKSDTSLGQREKLRRYKRLFEGKHFATPNTREEPKDKEPEKRKFTKQLVKASCIVGSLLALVNQFGTGPSGQPLYESLLDDLTQTADFQHIGSPAM